MGSSKKSVQGRRPGRPRGTGTGPARELTPDEIARLTKCCGTRDRALVWLCLGGGLRIGEAASLRLTDVASDGSVLVEASRAKSRRSRRVYLVPEARKHLAAWLAERPTDRASAALFPGRDRSHGLHPNWAVQHVQALLRGAGIEGATSHSLRRSHANTLRRHGVDLVVIQGQLGHSSLATTAVYMGASEVERSAAVSRIRF